MSKVPRHVNRRKKAEFGVIQEFPIVPGECRKEVLAYTICVNGLFFNGDMTALIPHLKNDHCMSFEQIKIGIDEVRREVGDCFEGWEKFY